MNEGLVDKLYLLKYEIDEESHLVIKDVVARGFKGQDAGFTWDPYDDPPDKPDKLDKLARGILDDSEKPAEKKQ